VLLSALLLSALVAAPSIAFAGPTAAAGGRSAEARQVHQQAAAFRATFGFRSDPAFVDTTFREQRFDDAEWGVPLDRAEAAEVHRRVDVQESVGRALRKAAADPGSAGAYFDESAGHVPVFLTTRDPAKARGAVAGVMPGSVPRTFAQVRYSTKELLALQARVNADLYAGRLSEQGITSTAIDTRANAVVVGSSVVTDALRGMLQARYGDGLVLAREPESQGGDACTTRATCPPAKGGIEIRSTYNGNFCTTGPMVRVASSHALRILTGGHCLGLSGGTGTSRRWTNNGIQLGWSEFSTWATGAKADVGLINPSTYPITGDKNLLYRASNADIVGMQGWKPTEEQIQGSLVCRAAAVSGYVCGTIVLTNKTKSVDGRSIDHQWVVDFDACPGDSGAPYLLGNVAWGIHSDSSTGCNPSTGEAWYSPMGWVSTVLAEQGHPIEMCTDAGCTSSANTWALQGALNGNVWNPSLVKLLDGRVLQVGGQGSDPIGAAGTAGSAPAPQLFDPATGSWSDTAPPPWLADNCAEQFGVGLMDGRVLVGGGISQAGGSPDPCAGTAYVFDPTTQPDGSWTTAKPMPRTIQSAGAVQLNDGRAFVTGGTGADGRTSVALAWSPTSGNWTTLTPAPKAGIDPLVLRLNDGRVLVTGGYVIDNPSAPRYSDNTSAYLYNPTSGTWSTTTSVGARGVAGVVLSNGRVVVAGGQHLSWNQGQGYAFSTTVRVLDPATGAWAQLASLRTGRAHFTLVQLASGQLLAAAGLVASSSPASGAPSRTADVFDWATNTWYSATSLRASRAAQGSVILDDASVLAAGGSTGSSETYTAGDVTPPSVATPWMIIASPPSIGTSTVPTRISWTATDAGGSGLGLYDIARSLDGGPFSTLATSLTSASYSANLSAGHTYRFEVRGRDNAGNLGPWRAGATVTPGVIQQTSGSVRYTGTWSTATSSSYLGGSVKYANRAGASASFTFTGRSIAYLTTRASGRGAARIYVDGVLVTTLNLQASSTAYRFLAFQKSWTTAATHTIKVVVVGTPGHPRVDIDAFAYLR